MDHLCYLSLVFAMLFASVHCYPVIACWEGAGLLAFVCDIYCVFVAFWCGVLG